MRQSAIDLSSECSQAERARIRAAIREHLRPGNFLEIGTAAGGTLKQIIGWTRDAGVATRFWVLDPFTYFEDQLEKVRANLRGAEIDPDEVEFLIGTTDSQLAPQRALGTRFSAIFIDGDHRALPVTKDLQWAEQLEVGGLVFAHDYCAKFEGVIWAIDRFLARNPGFELLGRSETLVVLRRKDDRLVPVDAAELRRARIVQTLLKWKYSIRKRLAR